MYDLEIRKAVTEIKKKDAKLVCLQLPDGLKPRAGEICDAIRQGTQATPLIWAGSCFGACDLPLQVERLGVDLLISWGHSEWRFS